MSPKETLHLDSSDLPRTTLSENNPVEIKELFTILPDGETAVGLAGVVQTDALGDCCSFAWGEVDQAPSDGVAVICVTGGTFDGGTLFLIGGESARRGEVSVRLALAVCPPHESCRET